MNIYNDIGEVSRRASDDEVRSYKLECLSSAANLAHLVAVEGVASALWDQLAYFISRSRKDAVIARIKHLVEGGVQDTLSEVYGDEEILEEIGTDN